MSKRNNDELRRDVEASPRDNGGRKFINTDMIELDAEDDALLDKIWADLAAEEAAAKAKKKS